MRGRANDKGMAYLFVTRTKRTLTHQDLLDMNRAEPYDINNVVISINAAKGITGDKKAAIQAPAFLYAPQQPTFTPNVCYHCLRLVTNPLDGYFQLTGCKINHNLEEDTPPNSAFNVLHIECYDHYLFHARQGKIQCRICDLNNIKSRITHV